MLRGRVLCLELGTSTSTSIQSCTQARSFIWGKPTHPFDGQPHLDGILLCLRKSLSSLEIWKIGKFVLMRWLKIKLYLARTSELASAVRNIASVASCFLDVSIHCTNEGNIGRSAFGVTGQPQVSVIKSVATLLLSHIPSGMGGFYTRVLQMI